MIQFVSVQISPKRWVVAEKSETQDCYRVITKPLKSSWEAGMVKGELEELDTKDYSDLTLKVLLED